MLQRIHDVENTPGGMVFDSVTKNKSKLTTYFEKPSNESNDNDEDCENYESVSSRKSAMVQVQDNSSHVAKPALKRVMEIEDALTRVQARKQAAIAQLHRMEMGDIAVSYNGIKVDLAILKTEAVIQSGNVDDASGGNFIEALESAADEVWEDGRSDN